MCDTSVRDRDTGRRLADACRSSILFSPPLSFLATAFLFTVHFLIPFQFFSLLLLYHQPPISCYLHGILLARHKVLETPLIDARQKRELLSLSKTSARDASGVVVFLRLGRVRFMGTPCSKGDEIAFCQHRYCFFSCSPGWSRMQGALRHGNY